MAWIYILECNDGYQYVGITERRPLARWAEHVNSEWGAIAVKKHRGVRRFLYVRQIETTKEALRLEKIWKSSSVIRKAIINSANYSCIEPRALKEAAKKRLIKKVREYPRLWW